MAKAAPTGKERRYSPIYTTWRHLRERCDNPNSVDYNNYGARGISYDVRWKSFENFYKDMASTHFKGASLDRIDNDGDYCLANCRWATRKEQANNTRRNRLFTINGETKTLAQWIERSNIKSSTVRQRLYVYGWTIEKALFTERI